MDEDHDYDPDPNDGRPTYRSPEQIQSFELSAALHGLALLGDDPCLRMQVTNLTVVDQAIMGLEQRVLHRLIDEERTPSDDAVFLLALSQMWIFAAYELLRTWRQRAKDIVKWAENGGLASKIEAMQGDLGYRHPAREFRVNQLQKALDDPSVVDTVRASLRKSHIVFSRLEWLRIGLAKHEIAGRKNSVAFAPGYGRINRSCGSLEFELANEKYIIGNISRRDVADEIRILADGSPPQSDEELASFDAFMTGKDYDPPSAADWAEGKDV